MLSSSLDSYQVTGIVASCCGGAAAVYSAVHSPSGQHVALKRYFVDKTRDRDHHDLMQQEVLIAKELQHPNILPYLTSFVHGHELYVVTPLMSYGSCRDIINKYFPEGFPELVCAIILKEVLLALEYLHKQGYIHRGIRASHVFLSSSGAVCLGGLRSAASLMVKGKRQKSLHSLPPPNHNNSNLIWLSPEVLEQNVKGYDEKSDVYSLGMLGCELGNGAVPFSDVPRTLMLTEKVRGSCPQLLDCSTFPAEALLDEEEVQGMFKTDSGVGESVASGSALHIRQTYASRKLTEHFHLFCELCLQRDPAKRPTTSQLLAHAFFKQIRKTDSLPSLIGRVRPIQPQPDDMSALLLEEKISKMEIEKSTEWDF